MLIADPANDLLCDEFTVIDAELALDGAHILELGCGKAEKTRTLARSGKVANIVAMEVDAIQHARNLLADALPGVTFQHGAAEAIPCKDESFDIVMMFKSLHHVPTALMDRALDEIRRVLKPGGMAWISEPVYAGEFNEILRLFHDEKLVREAAFAAVRKAVDDGRLGLVKQRFFTTSGRFESFEQFEDRVIRVTHTHHELSPELLTGVREKFTAHLGPQGAHFRNPMRVDILRKNP